LKTEGNPLEFATNPLINPQEETAEKQPTEGVGKCRQDRSWRWGQRFLNNGSQYPKDVKAKRRLLL